MDKNQTYDYLTKSNIKFEITEHEAVFNMDELGRVDVPHPGRDAKNLFVRDDKKKNYYMITVLGNKRVDLKQFKKDHGTRHLSFASPDDLQNLLHVIPGAVTPLGLLNDETKEVKIFLDDAFLKNGGIIGVHPCDNTATVWLQTKDLINLIEGHGNPVETIKI